MQRDWIATLLLTLAALPAAARPNQEPQQDLSGLSIEELAQLPVRSASKVEEPLSKAATALFVITEEDVARSSATSLPEVLRIAPNLHVEQINAGQYAVTARGFNGYANANKLLVLIDGRSVYSTLHSGVFWELHAPLLEDLKQVEVISGPGGTLYGPNAVNGVISIVSKDAGDTPGLLARGTAASRERTAGLRYGLRLGEDAAVRVSANYHDREGLPAGTAGDLDDAMRGWQAGFRADIGSGRDRFTLQGDVFDNDSFLASGDGSRGHNLVGRWEHAFDDRASLRLQGYYDYSELFAGLAVDRLETVDVEAQYSLRGSRHELVLGAGLRTSRDEFINNLNAFQLDPPRERLWIWNSFVQDRLALTPELSVIAGAKLEGSSFTGVQLLPNLRLAYQPSDGATFWASVSRAVRTPSRIDRDLTEPTFLAPAPDFRSEKLTAFELGYRGQPGPSTSLSLSLFYNRYRDLRSIAIIGPIKGQLANDVRGESYGLEAWGTHQIADWWRLSAGAALLRKDFEVAPGRTDFSNMDSIGRDPEYRFSLRTRVTPLAAVQIDASLRAVGPLDRPRLDGYVEADARIGWNLSDTIELFVAGNNLLHARHAESNDADRAQLIERSVLAGARLRI